MIKCKRQRELQPFPVQEIIIIQKKIVAKWGINQAKRGGETERKNTHTHTCAHTEMGETDIERKKANSWVSVWAGFVCFISSQFKSKKQKRVKLFTCTSNGKLVIVLTLMSPLEWLCAIFLAEVAEVSWGESELSRLSRGSRVILYKLLLFMCWVLFLKAPLSPGRRRE